MEMLPTTQEASPAEGRISAFVEVRAGKMASLRQASEKAFHQEEGQPRSKFLGASPEKKIQAALCTIQEAYLEKVSGLEQTIESLVKKCSSLESKNEDLEFFSNELQTRLSASQQNYQGLSVKYETLLNSQNQLVDKYNQLRRYALELDSFKKKIINLSGPNSVPIETNMIEQSILIQDGKLVPRTSGSAEKLQNAFRDCNISSPRGKENVSSMIPFRQRMAKSKRRLLLKFIISSPLIFLNRVPYSNLPLNRLRIGVSGSFRTY
ncbi:hypothetical protein DSO57_1001802 [Entomophthora muscae]|uniref:Uncharacterized protein n=1 Tax=Entomophthora muscae TaxID=34485 RepID=A0ACC2U6T8_9FUNG|nr:hypothetical protein DSO57_1001802 [Entomophthora muscae]